MRLTLSLHCPKCGKLNPVPAIVGKPVPDVTCADCQSRYIGTGEVDVTDGVFSRSEEELDKGDFTLSVIFAAMAVECEIARLYFKWRMIDYCLALDNLEEEFRKLTAIVDRLDATARLLTSLSFNEFVQRSSTNKEMTDWLNRIGASEILNGLATKTIQEKLFWPRNRILHFGETNFDFKKAISCLIISRATLAILGSMDELRRSSLRHSSGEPS